MNICIMFCMGKSKFFILPLIFIFTLIMSISLGAVSLSPLDIFNGIFHFDGTMTDRIVMYARLPRAISAMGVGAFLSLAGLVLQSVLNNPIAGPSVIGINAGAGFFSLLAMIFLPHCFWAVPFFGFVGALCSALLVYFIGRKTGASKLTIVLSGVAVSSLFGAFSDTLLTFYPSSVGGKTAFSIGGLSGINTDIYGYSLLFGILGVILAISLSNELNVMALGDDLAQSLGVNVKKVRFFALVTSSILVGSAISIAGLISFAGLICPHMARKIFGSDIKILSIQTLFLGSSLVLFCDTLSRILFAPYEIPVGIVLSFLGAPFFIYLLLSKKRGKEL